MGQKEHASGQEELRRIRRGMRGLPLSAAIFSVFVNLLTLTAPLYMLQVYDRVLSSGSEATLVALSLLMTFLFLVMGSLDYARGRLLAIAIFHPLLGLLAVIGGAVLVAITLINQWITRDPMKVARSQNLHADQLAGRLQTEAQLVHALRLADITAHHWEHLRRVAVGTGMRAADRQSMFAVAAKTYRQFLQSAMLGLGAYLALQGEISPGAMIAGSILLSRALGPVDLAVGQWAVVQHARASWLSLAARLSKAPPATAKTALPVPKAHVQLSNVTVIPEGQSFAVLQNVSFALSPGTAMGVIGPSGAGKSTLAQVMTGALRPSGGTVRLDGAALGHYAPADLGRHVGYLPQHVVFFDGTVAENIAGFQPDADDADIIVAATAAGAHELILSLRDGYDTVVRPGMSPMSGGQLQRICLARALFGAPPLVVLDQPNSNLDHDGSVALSTAIHAVKARGGTVVIMAHRPSVIQHCDQLMVLDHGRVTDIGPREDILRKAVRNASHLLVLPSIDRGDNGQA